MEGIRTGHGYINIHLLTINQYMWDQSKMEEVFGIFHAYVDEYMRIIHAYNTCV